MAGGERSLAEIVLALSKQSNMEIGVVFPYKGKLETLFPTNISKYYSETFWWLEGCYSEKYNIRDKFYILRQNIKTARQIIKEFSPDIVVTNTSVICGFAIAAKIESVPHCWHIRETTEQMQRHFILGDWLTNKIMSWLSEFIYVNSDYLKKECHKYFKNIFIVRQAMECTPIQKHLVANNKVIIAVIGHISRQKGQMEAVEAYKILEQQKCANISLLLVGYRNEKSEYYQDIKKQIDNRDIKFVQFVENMESIYAKIDIALVCSLETFGRVSIEAMKHSIPVIAANVGASVDNIKDGYNGYLYELGNPEDLAKKIMLLQNPDVRNKMGRNGYMFAMENFSEKNMINDFMEPLSKIFRAS